MAEILYIISLGAKYYYTTISEDIIQYRGLFSKNILTGWGVGGQNSSAGEKHWLIFGKYYSSDQLWLGIKFFSFLEIKKKEN